MDNNPIEALIRFIVEHIYLVFIVGGVIWSIFSKMAKPGAGPGPGPQRRPSGMPDFGGGGMPQRTSGPLQRTEVPAQRPEPPVPGPARPPSVSARPSSAGPLGRAADRRTGSMEPSEEGLSGGEGRSSEWAEPWTDAPAFPEALPSVRRGELDDRSMDGSRRQPLRQQQASPHEAEAARASGLTGEEIRQAVLWAEIIGPPRSRKPYRR
ncbi:hypothetical protein [Paenibacillus sp. P22]|uniref:hypothetical protein n=1 Tax=Paenibacillus sp. P22 TaxID=483908 RepID=UPI000433D0B1|nr:hypothetical protein [Paenibacillus sp. P22]CDN41741.1 hypothetical protein BN871_AK_00130 [Paenibacillus sp. P22]